jgi:energy-coupling factor transporter ATP-binding protein EcfA2
MERISVRELRDDAYSKIKNTIDSFVDGYKTSLLLTGYTGSGKTTILKEIPFLFEGSKFIFINTNIVYNAFSFFGEVAKSLPLQTLETKNWEPYADQVMSYIENDSDNNYIFLIDDINILFSLKETVAEYLRSKYMYISNMLIIASMREIYINNIDIKNPFYGQLIYYRLQKLSDEKSSLIIESVYPGIDKKDKDFVLKLSEGNVEMVNLISNLIVSNKNRKGNFEKLIYDVIRTRYTIAPQQRAILLTLIKENKSITEISKETDIKNGAVNSQVKRLLKIGYVFSCENKKYRISEFIKFILSMGYHQHFNKFLR